MQDLLKKIVPHIIAIISFIVISSAFYQPILEGKKIQQGDIHHWKGMAQEAFDHRREYDEEALWTNSMFSGMPLYQISTRYTKNLVVKLDQIYSLGLPRTIGIMYILMLGFYILGLCLRVNPWLALFGGLIFGLSTFNVMYLGAGHVTKIKALAFVAPFIGGILYAFRVDWKKGAMIAAVFFALHLNANHFQITYYTMYGVIFIGLAEIIRLIVAKKSDYLLKSLMALTVAVVIGLIPNLTNLICTYKYSKHTMRGKTELTVKADQKSKPREVGLEKDYILEYSLGNEEVFSLLIPNVKGGSGGYIGSDKEAMDSVDRQYKQAVSRWSRYWGEQKFSGGAFYFGVIGLMLFFFAMVYLKDTLKWGALAFFLLSVLLSLKYGSLTDFFIENIPMFSKFRDTKMILSISSIFIPMIAMLGLDQLLKSESGSDKKVEQRIYIFSGLSLAVTGLIYLMPTTFFEFLSNQDYDLLDRYLKQGAASVDQIEDLKEQIINARISLFSSDALKAFGLTAVLCAAIFVIYKKLIDVRIVAVVVGVIALIDIWSVDRRYFNNDKHKGKYIRYEDAKASKNPFPVSKADIKILELESKNNTLYVEKLKVFEKAYKEESGKKRLSKIDAVNAKFAALNSSTNYRVMPMSSPFVDTKIAYRHKSAGGYHAAKLSIYQDLIDFKLLKELSQFGQAIQSGASPFSALKNASALNMLNTKYIVANPNSNPILNPHALGNAWFVGKKQIVEDADAEILAVSDNGFEPKKVAIVRAGQDELFANVEEGFDSAANIRMTNYKANHMEYEANCSKANLAVFSEIYYPEGWTAYIDGNEVDFGRVNYVLRGLTIPAGKHKIEFKFEPSTYFFWNNIALVGSLLIFAAIGGIGFLTYKEFQS